MISGEGKIWVRKRLLYIASLVAVVSCTRKVHAPRHFLGRILIAAASRWPDRMAYTCDSYCCFARLHHGPSCTLNRLELDHQRLHVWYLDFTYFHGLCVGGSWRKKKQATDTSATPTNTQNDRHPPTPIFSVSFSFAHQRRRGGKEGVRRRERPLLSAAANSHSKSGAQPSFGPSEIYANTKRHTIEMKEHPHSEEGTKCPNCSNQPTTQAIMLFSRRNKARPDQLTSFQTRLSQLQLCHFNFSHRS